MWGARFLCALLLLAAVSVEAAQLGQVPPAPQMTSGPGQMPQMAQMAQMAQMMQMAQMAQANNRPMNTGGIPNGPPPMQAMNPGLGSPPGNAFSTPPQQGSMGNPPASGFNSAPAIKPGVLSIAVARQRAGMMDLFNKAQQQPTQQQPGQPPMSQSYPAPSSPLARGFNNPSDFTVPAGERPGTPSAPTRPVAPSKPFIGKLGEMLSGILGGGLKAFGSSLKTITGAGGASVFSGVLGMMGYSGPYGYDPFGPGQSQDPYSQVMPETNSCYQLLETWLRQCSAQPEAFLETEVVTAPIAPSLATSFLELSTTTAPILTGLRGVGTHPTAPKNPSSPEDPDTPAPPSRPGMFDQIMSGAGNTPAMGGMVSQTLGPDTYNPWVADGVEPDEFQISGPEKCTRLMNNWLWKCAMSPM